MYQSCDFVFAGESASMYGLSIYDIGSKKHTDNDYGNQANIVERRLPNRITPLHYGVRYHDQPLRFTLIFGSERDLDRYEMQAVSKWLTGYQDYQWLSICQPDMDHIQFRCLIQKLTPISVGWIPVAFEAQIVCDCAYGYGYPFEEKFRFGDKTKYIFYNDSTIRENLKPEMIVELDSGCTEFAVVNQTTGAEMRFSGLPSGGITIMIDNENEIITHIGQMEYDLYNYFNFHFFDLASGDNTIVFTGSGNITIKGRCMYNVGA